MKIAIDITPATVSKAGIGYHTFELTKAIIHNFPNDKIYLLGNSEDSFVEFEKIISTNKNVSKLVIKAKKPGFFWIIKCIFGLRKEGIDILVSTSSFLFGILRRNTVQLIHDIAPIKMPEYFTKKGSFMYKLLFNIYIRIGKSCVTNCKTTYDEIVNYYPRAKNKLSIAGIGIHEWTKQSHDQNYYKSIKQKYNLPENYFISVGTIEPRKNHLNMAKAFLEFSKYNKDFQYFIIGKKGWKNDTILGFLENPEVKDKIKLMGYIPEEDMPGIIDQAKALLMVSFYEGFGLPALEAYSRKVPVLVSNIKVFKEIFENSVYFANPNDYFDIFKNITNLIDKPLNYNFSIIPKYNWDDVAVRTIKAITLN